MTRSFSRLPLGIALPLLLLALGLAMAGYDYSTHTRLSDSETERAAGLHVTETMTLLQGVLDNFLRRGDLEGGRACIANLASVPQTTLALAVDERDRVFIASDTRLIDAAAGRAVPQFDVATAQRAREADRGVVYVSESRDSVVGYYPIHIGARPTDPQAARRGVFFLQYDVRLLKAQSRHELQGQLFTKALHFFVAFVLLGVVLWFAVTKRVARLVAATREFSAGDWSARADVRGADELARLGEAFNRMAETIADDQRVLRESEERFRTLFEQASDLFELTDLEGRFLGVNSATCRSLGYTRDELLRLSLEDVDPQFDRGRFAAAGREIPPPASVTLETTHRRKDGSVFPVEVQQSVIQIGGAARVLLVVRDITERKQAQEENSRLQIQLSQAQKMESVGRLSGGVAHNLNNMLTVILGHTELAVIKVDTAKPIHDDLVQIQKAAQRSADLTSELLAFARRQMTASRVLDLNETVAKMLKRVKRIVGEDITLAWIPAPDLWPVRIDPTQIEQILAKLCANARDAIDGTGKVTIETRNVVLDEAYCRNHPGAVVGACAALVVSDTGCGIARDVIGSVFEPFFTTKGPGRGTGLGLAAVYGIVKQNDGWIYVDSEPGRGATFTVYLPRLAGVSADAAVAASPDTPSVH